MSATAEFDVPFTLTSAYGTLKINQYEETIDGYYLLQQDGCSSGKTLRVVRDNIPQASGEIPHPRFTDGYEMKLKIGFWKDPDNKPAYHIQRVQMLDFLMLHLGALLAGVDGRIQWTPGFDDPDTPGGLDDRMLDKVLLAEWPLLSPEDFLTTVAVTLVSPYPYVMRAAETVTSITADSPPFIVTNPGSAAFYPVFKVYGATGAFNLVNEAALDEDGDALQIIYDDGLPGAISIPGGGQYAEITTFENKIYLNGDGANLKPGINVETSDFWPLMPGDNPITCGADCDILWNYAWS